MTLETFNATALLKPKGLKVSHFLDNSYVQQFMRENKIEFPELKRGPGNATMLDTRLKPLLEWWMNKGYKSYVQ